MAIGRLMLELEIWPAVTAICQEYITVFALVTSMAARPTCNVVHFGRGTTHRAAFCAFCVNNIELNSYVNMTGRSKNRTPSEARCSGLSITNKIGLN